MKSLLDGLRGRDALNGGPHSSTPEAPSPETPRTKKVFPPTLRAPWAKKPPPPPPPPPPPKPRWRFGTLKIKLPVKNMSVTRFQEKMMRRLTDQAAKAITGGVSGLLVLLTLYKVISSRESVIAESRKEVRRQEHERKERLAMLRRSLAGPLRAAARDLSARIKEILEPTTGPASSRSNYFARHYLTDPEQSIDSTLYRVCRYLFWVNQLEANIHSGECSLDDVWQIAVDIRLERVRRALASDDEDLDAIRHRERLYEVIDAELARHRAEQKAHAEGREDDLDPEGEGEQPPPGGYETAGGGGDDEAGDTTEKQQPHVSSKPRRSSSRSMADWRAMMRLNNAPASAPWNQSQISGTNPDEPNLRISRFPLRMVHDTQTAVAEVFGARRAEKSHRGGSFRGNPNGVGWGGRGGGYEGGSNKKGGGREHGSTVGTVSHHDGGFDPTTASEISYTDFVMKLEAALGSEGAANDPWVRWLVPLHLQFHRYASLQARVQRQLTPSESRELLAARVRLRRVNDALMGLLEVLRRRLDDPWFRDNLKSIQRAREAADSSAYSDVVRSAAGLEASRAGEDADDLAPRRGFLGLRALARILASRRNHRAQKNAARRWGRIRQELPVVMAEGRDWWAHDPSLLSRRRFYLYGRMTSSGGFHGSAASTPTGYRTPEVAMNERGDGRSLGRAAKCGATRIWSVARQLAGMVSRDNIATRSAGLLALALAFGGTGEGGGVALLIRAVPTGANHEESRTVEDETAPKEEAAGDLPEHAAVALESA